MAVTIHNSLTRRKEPFEPLVDGRVGIYVCGVTVYDRSHLGHAKSAINFDLIVRWLRYRGYDVRHVTNFTDVDDKIIARANEMGIDPLRLSGDMIGAYEEDMARLKVKRADVYPKASETMPEIIAMVKGLEEKGYAYESNGSVYFSVRRAAEYGKLSGQSLDQTVAGARVDPGEDKRDPMDFALWKAAKPGEIAWDSPWGKGRPGWHIECSAMCLKHIGPTVDIHGGGTDLVFPHHENEILQSEAYNGAPFVRYWMHNGMLTIGEEKMSKSLKNFFTIHDILARYRPEVVRFFVLNATYSAPLEYDETSLEEARKALEKLNNAYDAALAALDGAKGADDAQGLCDGAWGRVEERMDDDFSSREAIAVMYDFAREANRLIGEGRLSRKGAGNVVGVFRRFNQIFDVLEATRHAVVRDAVPVGEFPDPETITKEGLSDGKVEEWVQLRSAARAKKDFAYADRVRKRLAELGVEVSDTKDGAVWKRK
ncbi:MAG: cysteine--tRNA ligase [Candidatus Thermoplasmatota archaeon]